MQAGPLIRTKLQRPRLPRDLIRRPRLLDRLRDGSDRRLTLVSAMAGTGKTTLLAQWLEESSRASAWLSLDEHDNDPIALLSYLCGAIRTVFPSACASVLSLLSASQAPPPRVMTTLIVNELDELLAGPSRESGRHSTGLILALDDYHHITEPVIDEILSSLIEHSPRGVHLALATRIDPPLPLAGLRARGEMTEVRSADLRFTPEETHAFLEGTIGRELNPETIRLLQNKTEGWIVGVRLAALSMRNLPGDEAFAQRFNGTNSALIVEYLASEVLNQQSPEVQDFLLRISALDRFCAPLCEALTGVPAVRSQEILKWIARANLFLVPLDEEGAWYRYHHLFRDLLRHLLEQQASASDVAVLHARAGAWFARNELIDEALRHFLAAGDTAAAVALVTEQRYALMNQARWLRLEHYLNAFSPDTVDQNPELLMLKTWLLYHRGRREELPAALQRLEEALDQAFVPPEEVKHLQGEISAVRSYLFFRATDLENAWAYAQQALEATPRELWIVRTLARLHLAGVLHMKGDSKGAYATIYRGFEEEETRSEVFKASLVMTTCYVHWLDADLQGMAQAARECIALSRKANSPQFLGYGLYHLGQVHYQQNDLDAAERSLATVVQQPYLNYGDCFADSACCLTLVRQALGQPDEAQAVIESAMAFLLETGNTSLMPLIRSVQAELALRQGQIAKASQWAAQIDPVPPFSPVHGVFWPHLTLVKIWLAQDTPTSRNRAADLLAAAREYVETTHNTRFLIEVLALQAMLKDGLGKRQPALELLAQAVALAEAGGFIRLFVDLGPPLDRLLDQLQRNGVAPKYVTQILAAFGPKDHATADVWQSTGADSAPLIEPLTRRELEVLALLDRHLTNREIAEELVISPSTVKTHTLDIYRKLDVNSRRQAAARARQLGLT